MERWSVGGEGQDMNRTLEDPVEFKTYGKITSLGVCPLDDDIVFCGDSLGHVYILKLCNGSKKRLDEPNVEQRGVVERMASINCIKPTLD